MARRHSHAEEEKIADQWIYVPPLNFSCSSLFSIDHGSLVRPFGSVEREQWPDPLIGIQWSEKIRGFVSCCVRWNEAFRSFLIFLCVRNISLSTIEIELDRSCFLSFYLAPLFYFSDTTIKEGGGGGREQGIHVLARKKREEREISCESQESTAQKGVENLRNIESLGKKLGFLFPRSANKRRSDVTLL